MPLMCPHSAHRATRIKSLLRALLPAAALVLALSGCSLLNLLPHQIGEGITPKQVDTAEPLTELDAEAPEEVEAPATEEVPLVDTGALSLPREPVDYTLMVYMVGSDLETGRGYATHDIEEMLAAQVDPTHVNVVVYTGGSQRWHANIPNDRNCVLDLTRGRGKVAAATDRSLNMGAPETLSSFVSWACENYPAEHTALILWDHGAGPEGGYGFDQVFRNDSLSLAELSEAMDAAGFGSERMLDWVGFDACLMGSLENLQVWRPYAHYLVGSEDIESGDGWNYAFLYALNETYDPQVLTSAAVKAYGAYYDALAAQGSTPNVTLSAVDLDAVGAIEDALQDLSVALLADFDAGDFAPAGQARGRCRCFGATSGSVTTAGTPLVDLADLAERMGRSHPQEAQAVVQAVEDAVLTQTTNLTGAHGISLYFPIAAVSPNVTPSTDAYGRMIAGYASQGQEAAETDWAFPALTLTDGSYTATLGATQDRSLATASYTVLSSVEGRGYVPLVANVRIDPAEDGTIAVPQDPLVLVAADGTSPVPVTQTDGSAERQVYQCASAFLMPGADFVDSLTGSEQVNLSLTLDSVTGEVGLASAALGDGQSASDARASLDLSHYKSLMLYLGGWQYPERADDGSMLPYTAWDALGGNYLLYQTPLEGGLSFAAKHVSELEGTYVLQVVLTDVNGNRHASELLPLAAPTRRTVRVDTAQGQLGFLITDDHAELLSYKGKDAQLDVPASVEGLPVTAVADEALSSNWSIEELTLPDTVTVIGANALRCHNATRIELGTGLTSIGGGALSGCTRLEELQLPEGLTSIGRCALRRLGVRTLTLPASLTELGEGALTGCAQLESFEVAEGCTAAQALDGALFSADGTCLVAFPAGRAGSYAAPRGTTVVGYGAFADTKLESVTLPEGLTTIDNCAFWCGGIGESYALTSITLPDTLESVGALAFGATYRTSYLTDAPHLDTLSLGKSLSYVGDYAFSGLNLGAFAVDAANPYFSSPGGMLCNKTGDTILAAPSGLGQVVVVPDGVTTLGKEVFALIEAGSDIVLPATVSRISVLAFPYHSSGNAPSADADRIYDVRFHCAEGTAAAQFAEKRHIPWDTETDPAALVAHRTDIEQEAATLTFLVYRDHAVLHALTPQATPEPMALVIPDTVDDVPVTEIDSLVQSGYATNYQSVTLPASLVSLDSEAIPRLCSYDGFALSGESAAYTVQDGVLFSADGTTLVAFSLADPDPLDAKTDEPFSYEVPRGTRTIGAGAFNQSQLEAVSTPSTLRVIQRRAFQWNSRLTSIQLAEGVERIDDYAFACPATSLSLPSSLTYLGDNALQLDGFEGLELPRKLKHVGDFVFYSYGDPFAIGSDALSIGPKLKTLGYGSLASLAVTSFEVDPANGSFASIDGLLVSKDGKTLLRCPAGRTGELRIPAGIEHLEPGCLDFATGITDVYFPASVIGADAYRSFGEGAAATQVTWHCARGSAAALYAQEHDIAWTDEGGA